MTIARHVLAGVLGVVVLAAAAAAAPLRAQPEKAGGEGLLTEVFYSGSYEHTYTGSPEASTQNPGTETVDAHFKFSESASLFTPADPQARDGLASLDSENSPVTITLTGGQTVTYSAHPEANCSATFSSTSGLKGAAFGSQQPPVYISVNGDGNIVAASAEPPTFPPVELRVHVTGGPSIANACAGGVFGPFASPANCNPRITLMTDPEWTASDRGFDHPPYGFLHAVAKVDPHTPTYTHRYHVDDTSQPTSTCPGTDTLKADSVFVLNNSHASGPPKLSPLAAFRLAQQKWDAAKRKVKERAQGDLRWTLQFGKDTCGLLVSGLTFTVAGAVLLNSTLAGVGTIVTTLTAPTQRICLNLLLRIRDDLDTIHDPPLGAIHRLARVGSVRVVALPSCARFRGRSLALCQRIRAAAERLTVDVPRLAAIDSAIATTVGRGSAAVAKRDGGALALQLGHLTSLSTQHGTALATEQTDTVGLAQALANAGLDAKVSPTESAKGIASWLAALASHGVSVAALKTLGGSALAPVSGSYVSILSGGKVAPPTAQSKPPPPPPAIGAAGERVLVANSGSNSVMILNGTGGVVATVPVGAKPWKMAVSPDHKLAYVTESGSNTVALLDLKTDKVVGRITVGKSPTFVLLNRRGSVAYVANAGSNTISVVKTASRRVLATISTDVQPYALALSPDGNKLYVANCHYPSDSQSSVQVIQTSNNAVTATIRGFNCAEGVATTPRAAYVTNANTSAIGVIDTATNTLTGSIATSSGSQCMAVSPDGKTLYATGSDGISVIDTATNKVARTIAVGSVDCLALSRNGSTLYATSASRNLFFIVNATTGAILRQVQVGATPVGVTPA